MRREFPRLGMMAEPWRNHVSFFLVEDREVEGSYHNQPFLLVDHPDGSIKWEQQPEGFGFQALAYSFRLEWQEAQSMFNMLWNAGFRPPQHIDQASRLAATEAHLQDMRAITFSKLNIEPPKEK